MKKMKTTKQILKYFVKIPWPQTSESPEVKIYLPISIKFSKKKENSANRSSRFIHSPLLNDELLSTVSISRESSDLEKFLDMYVTLRISSVNIYFDTVMCDI